MKKLTAPLRATTIGLGSVAAVAADATPTVPAKPAMSKKMPAKARHHKKVVAHKKAMHKKAAKPA